MIDINDVYAYLSENEPETARNFFQCYEMLENCIDNAVSVLKNRMKTAIDNDDYSEIDRLRSYREKLDKYKKQINECIESGTDTPDGSIKHSIDEDFTYKKISGFGFEGQEYIADKWQDTIIKICALLARKSEKRFKEMVTSEDFKRKKRVVFSQELSDAGINKKIPDTDYYVLVNLSANDTVRVIKKMLLYFGINPASFYVYLKDDFTILHNND